MSDTSELTNAINRLRASKTEQEKGERVEAEPENAHYQSAYEAGCVEGRMWALNEASYAQLKELAELHASAFAFSATAHSARSQGALKAMTSKLVNRETPDGFLEGFAAGASRIWEEIKDKI